jgi:hypothetical protein
LARHQLVDATRPFPQRVAGLLVDFESLADFISGLGDLHLRLGRPIHHAAPPHLHLRRDFSLVRAANQPKAVDVDLLVRYQIGEVDVAVARRPSRRGGSARRSPSGEPRSNSPGAFNGQRWSDCCFAWEAAAGNDLAALPLVAQGGSPRSLG